MFLPSTADKLMCKEVSEATRGVLRGNLGSFKLKLVVYFSVISLLPFAAAFSGLEAVTDRNETRRVDGILETGVRAGLAHLTEEAADAQRRAADLAPDPRFQHALAKRDQRALVALLAGRPNVGVDGGRGLTLGTITEPAIRR